MLEKTYLPAAVEARRYAEWEENGAFAADPDSCATPFTIMIPPPNVTGSLHMGHALTFTLQDTLIRWRRMQGRDALWQPGTDHAGIATQMVVERLLAEQQSSRRALGRAGFIERVWQWKQESGSIITRQLRRLGASLDWPRERFTMDPGLSAAVRRVFVTLHREGLVYRARRLVNWDPKFQSAISDLEVESHEIAGTLWHIRYPVEAAPGVFITVATTRPETMLGDVAVAVHPEDARYQALIGRHAVLPLVGRRIPIIADLSSDPAKGTGAVKITPAHDFNDFKVGERHRLPMPSVLDREAKVTLKEIAQDLVEVPGVAEPSFVEGLAGEDRFAARAAIVQRLADLDLLAAAEPHRHQVPHGDRSGVPIEPLLTWQWFCNAAELAKPAIAAVETGETVFVPKQWENTFFAWMRNLEPWCISRQLWWGHRIPAWYAPDGSIFVAETEEEAAEAARARLSREVALRQDEDVLDTWFSSALWPFSTLGWPEKTPELARYYPTDVLVTGFDIIFFWVARMMMMGQHFMQAVPFRTVYIHGLVRDERGQKMAKSKGNIIDPLALIDRYGADALRFAIGLLAGPGRDIKLGPARVEAARSFVTKLWNAARLCELNGVRPDPAFRPEEASLPLCRWMLDATNRATEAATAALESFRFDEYAAECHHFVWHVFCDWFLELAKPALAAGEDEAEVRATAAQVFSALLRLLHPLIPFVTEELWERLGHGPSGSLIRAPWPEPAAIGDAAAARAELEWMVRLISEIRTVRAEMNVPPATLTPILLKDALPATLARAEHWREAIGRLARVSEIRALEGEVPRGVAQTVVDEATVILPLAEIIDLATERARLDRERGKAAEEMARLRQKLADRAFVSRAPEAVVEENRERLAAAETELARLEAALRRIA